jgi:hypothetical protein
MLPSQLPGDILIVVLAIVDHQHRSYFISPFFRLVVMLPTGVSVSASWHVSFVQLIVMLSVSTSSSASHHASTSHGRGSGPKNVKLSNGIKSDMPEPINR